MRGQSHNNYYSPPREQTPSEHQFSAERTNTLRFSAERTNTRSQPIRTIPSESVQEQSVRISRYQDNNSQFMNQVDNIDRLDQFRRVYSIGANLPDRLDSPEATTTFTEGSHQSPDLDNDGTTTSTANNTTTSPPNTTMTPNTTTGDVVDNGLNSNTITNQERSTTVTNDTSTEGVLLQQPTQDSTRVNSSSLTQPSSSSATQATGVYLLIFTDCSSSDFCF